MSTEPTPPPTITTARLQLIRLTDTSPGSQHLQWFHENWCDPVATGWSMHGATKSLEESRLWMIEHMTTWDNWFYAVFLRDEDQPHARGAHIGSVSLRHQVTGPMLPPPRTFAGAQEVGTGAPLSEAEIQERLDEVSQVELNLRVLGYALFKEFHGVGYVTEAVRGLLAAYVEAIAAWKARGAEERGTNEGDAEKTEEKDVVFYIEAGVDQENPGSQKVLMKLGFKTVGLKIEKEKVWLNGAWRGPGWWITGMYL